ncbi:polysaccharide pyruvyl transferase family protein [Falsiroseomonas tokyonensis]|uniref:Polysaccharide pyruvyl transferase family protein n=2 Tax=Falsiroseomonas tokyonensis TaxID=430521 RepID=A0ABV7BZJ9_9PROT|nr:polysaccharide pyruvyl transferase family protein [Falsiroseomonas tokyonensis]
MAARPISIYWWKSPDFVNIGDEINLQVCAYVSGRTVEHAELAECDLLSIGSVVHFPVNLKTFTTRQTPIHVWGSGSLEPKPVPPGTPLVYHALRGPLTRCLTSASNDLPLGDPGLLAPRIWKGASQKAHRWGVIPHHSQRSAAWVKHVLANTPRSVMIDVCNPDFAATFKLLSSCDFIVSTSLHGLIFADAWGIPSIWPESAEVHRGKSWKYFDYFASVGRSQFRAVTLPPSGNLADLPQGLLRTEHLAGIPMIGDRLEASFPRDVF